MQVKQMMGALVLIVLLFGAVASLLWAAGDPAIAPDGVLNGASFLPPRLRSGSIAQGSIFSIFGANIGPDELVQALTVPLPTELGETSVTITQGEVSVSAIVLAAVAGQINAIMPSNAPLGAVEVTVTRGGATSAPIEVIVVEAAVGIFTANATGVGPGSITNFVSAQEQPLNTSRVTARPGRQ